MEWEWHPIDTVGIARFIDPNVTNLLPVKQSVYDLKQQSPQNLSPIIEILYNKLLEQQIWYAAEKEITLTGSQKIRRPDEILNGNREGTCLDLALLFCALCLGHQLIPIFVLLEGHALVAISVIYEGRERDNLLRSHLHLLQSNTVTDVEILRHLVDSGEYVLLECTGFARSETIPTHLPEGEDRIDGLLTFQKAVEAGRKQLDYPGRSLKFAFDVDIAHWMWGIKPHEANRQDTTHILQEQLKLLTTQINQRLISPATGTPENLTDERHSRIEHGCKLINQGKPQQALQYLTELKAELWHKSDSIIKYRLLANIGMARLGLEQISDAAAAFLEAKQYNPEDENALAFAAMGYTLQGNYQQAEELIQVVLQKNPANSTAHSLRVQMAPATDSLEEVVNGVPAAYRNNPYVMAALGQAALDRELFEEAENYFQAVVNQNEGNLDNIKVFLGITLMKSIAQDFPIILAGKIDLIKTQKLEKALNLFTEVIGGNSPNVSDLHSDKLAALVNRSNVLRLLKRDDEAIRDIEITLEVYPENAEFIRQYALLLGEKGEIEQAINYLQKIISNQTNLEASILAASFMMRKCRFGEARELLENFQVNNQSNNQIEELKAEAKRLQVQLYLEIRDYEKARQLSQSLLDEKPNDIFNLVSQINVLLQTDGEDSIQVIIEQAKESLGINPNVRDLIVLADLLYELKYYRHAVEIYERFVDKKLNNYFTHRLLNSYFHAGDYGAALNLCEELINQYEPIPYVSQIATYIYQSIDDLPAARKLCEDYLKLFSDDVSMQLRLALVNYATDNLEDLDKFLDSNPNIDNLSFDACKQLASLYKIRTKLNNFFQIIYEIRKRFYSDGQVHAFYLMYYLEGMRLYSKLPRLEQSEIDTLSLPITTSGLNISTSPGLDNYCHQSFEQIQSTCGVLLVDKFNNGIWYILDEQLNAEFSRQELASNHPLYQQLIGKKLGDEITISETPFSKNTLTIAAITDKYCAAKYQSFNLTEKLPGIKGFSSAQVNIDEKNGIDPNWLERFDEMLKKREENFNYIKSSYKEFKIPFGTFALVIHKNPIELWEILVNGFEPYIHSWSNPNEKLDDAVSLLQKGGLLVIDIISLLSMYKLGLADIAVQALGKFGIAQSTLELLQHIVEECQGWGADGYSIFGTVNGQQVMHLFNPEQVAQKKLYFEQIISWVRNNCLILPCQRALTINVDERKKRNEVLGLSFADTALITGETGRILYSDDQWLRFLVTSESGVKGVWTQALLNYLLRNKYIDNAKYHDATLHLIYWGYNYTPVEAETLLEAARRTEWSLKPPYTLVLKVFENHLTPEDYIPYVAVDFIYKLYNEGIVPHYRDYLILELLKAITTHRSQRKIIQQLTRNVKSRSPLLLHITNDILRIIEIWWYTQNLVT